MPETPAAAPSVVREISKPRFDAFVGYCRTPEVTLIAHELAWFGTDDNSLFATIIIDLDFEFSAIIFLADLVGRFRHSDQTDFFRTSKQASAALEALLPQVLADRERKRVQGDEVGDPVDFFAPRAAEKRLHINFKLMRDRKEMSSAHNLINVMMRWYDDRDGNFIEQFQTTGFDARMWELYLWATLISLGYQVTQPKQSPDFIARHTEGAFAIEATTVNPSFDRSGNAIPPYRPAPDEELAAYWDHYLPIKFAGPLTNKLAKKYWRDPTIAQIPLVFAIQDFHDDFAMAGSVDSLMAYLYGVRASSLTDERPTRIGTHTWGEKKVPSGFFNLPDSEHVSAVIFNSQGTISKFSRMGIKAGFSRDDVIIEHVGKMFTTSDEGIRVVAFSSEVDPDYWEEWITGLNVFHNPSAKRPLDPSWLEGAAHHTLDSDGSVLSVYPERHIAVALTVTSAR